jgi:hypothetical protein
MKLFLIKSYDNNSNPPGLFNLKNPDHTNYYFCEGYEDLKKTISCLTPGGYPSKKAEWFYKNLSADGSITILNSLKKSILLEIRQSPDKLPIEEVKNLPDIFGHAHELKRVSSALADKYFLLRPSD